MAKKSKITSFFGDLVESLVGGSANIQPVNVGDFYLNQNVSMQSTAVTKPTDTASFILNNLSNITNMMDSETQRISELSRNIDERASNALSSTIQRVDFNANNQDIFRQLDFNISVLDRKIDSIDSKIYSNQELLTLNSKLISKTNIAIDDLNRELTRQRFENIENKMEASSGVSPDFISSIVNSRLNEYLQNSGIVERLNYLGNAIEQVQANVKEVEKIADDNDSVLENLTEGAGTGIGLLGALKSPLGRKLLGSGAAGIFYGVDEYMESGDVAKSVTMGAAGTAGAFAGATAGATLGAAVGSFVPLVGTAIGGVVGGIAGGVIGAEGFSGAAENVYDYINPPEEKIVTPEGFEKFALQQKLEEQAMAGGLPSLVSKFDIVNIDAVGNLTLSGAIINLNASDVLINGTSILQMSGSGGASDVAGGAASDNLPIQIGGSYDIETGERTGPIRGRGGGGGTSQTKRYSPRRTSKSDIVASASSEEAKKKAEAYLGRNLDDDEWDELVRATYAEAGRNQKEEAMVMATILNRVRDGDKSVQEILREKNQFQAVTGTPRDRSPSRNFVQGPPSKTLESILGSTEYLEAIPHTQKNFTAASSKAYKAGTNIAFRDKMLERGGSIIGASVFTTNPDFSEIDKKLGSKKDKPEDRPVVDGEGIGDLRQEQQGKIRSMEVPPQTEAALRYASVQTGVGVRVTSGGQMSWEEAKKLGARKVGKKWVLPSGEVVGIGSSRHGVDIGAADIELIDPDTGEAIDLSTKRGQEIMKDFVKYSSQAGQTGFGFGPEYMGRKRLHVGGGKEATWGSSRKMLLEAMEEGQQLKSIDAQEWLKEQKEKEKGDLEISQERKPPPGPGLGKLIKEKPKPVDLEEKPKSTQNTSMIVPMPEMPNASTPTEVAQQSTSTSDKHFQDASMGLELLGDYSEKGKPTAIA